MWQKFLDSVNAWWVSFGTQHRIFAAFQIAITLWIVYLWFRLPAPGWAVAILAGCAAAMSIHEKMQPWQKSIWVLLIGALLIVELRAIKSDRDESQKQTIADRNAQNEAFQGVLKEQAKGFQATLSQSQRQFAATMQEYSSAEQAENRHFSRLLGEEAHTFNGTLDALTGGDSYTTIMPLFITGSPDNAEFPLLVSVRGKNPLYEVTIEMQEGPLDRQSDEYFASHLKEYLAGKLRPTFHFSSISTTYSQPLGTVIHPSADRINQYNFWTFSRNGPSREELQVRFNRDAGRWQMAWKVFFGRQQKQVNEMDFEGKQTEH